MNKPQFHDTLRLVVQFLDLNKGKFFQEDRIRVLANIMGKHVVSQSHANDLDEAKSGLGELQDETENTIDRWSGGPSGEHLFNSIMILGCLSFLANREVSLAALVGLANFTNIRNERAGLVLMSATEAKKTLAGE